MTLSANQPIVKKPHNVFWGIFLIVLPFVIIMLVLFLSAVLNFAVSIGNYGSELVATGQPITLGESQDFSMIGFVNLGLSGVGLFSVIAIPICAILGIIKLSKK